MEIELREKPNEAYLKVLFYANLIGHAVFLVLIIALLIVSLVFDWTLIPFYICSGLLVVSFIVFNIITPKYEYQRFSFEVEEDQIQIKSGIIFRKMVLIPMVRVQHVQYKSGPLLRKYGLATISVSTAAKQHELPGLLQHYARQLKDKIGEHAKVEEPYEQ